MSISVSTSKQQITATVADDKITATVSAGIGPTGPQGAPGATDYGQLANVPTSFNPAAHASRHAAAGSDPVTIVAAQVSDFTSAVVAAAPPTTNASLLVSGTLADARLSGNVVLATDSRLSDAREWSASTVSQADAEAGTSTTRFAYTPRRIFEAIAAWWSGSASKTKLDGIQAGATANQTDAYLVSRANHTGTQASSTISDFASAASAAAPVQSVAGRTGTVTLTKADVGLSAVDNTADSAKPVSTAQAAADAAVASAAASDATSKANAAQAYAIQRTNHTGTQAISTVSGLQAALDSKQPTGSYATLTDGKVPASQLPSYVDDVIEAANLAALPTTGETGKIYVTLDTNKTYRWSGSAYVEISASPGSTDAVPEGSTNLYYTNARASAAAPVQSVAGKTGAVSLVKADVGLGNVDNTSDASKPVSTAQAAADAAVASAAASDATSKANAAQAAAVQRANHTGTQTASTISDFSTAASAAAPVQSVAGRTGAVTIAAADVSGLGSLATQSSVSYASLTGTPSTFAPSAHKSSHATGGSDALSPADIGASAVGHTHTVSQITDFSSTLASPPAIGGTTPAAGSFTTLVASTSLAVPSGAAASPAAGHLYRSADTIRYRDSGNVERLLLNSADNLANLGSTATARSNLGLGSAATAASSDFAAASHNHAASAITSGTIATARLGSGSPSAANYLRGDGAWQTPTASEVGAASSAVVYEFTPTSRPASATGSNGSYTLSLPSGAKAVEFLAIGGGGGGGSGRRGAAGSARFGGGGGGGGNATIGLVAASTITTSLTILVGSGGAGGAAVTTDDTNGNNGSTGGTSSVTYNGNQCVQASPGSGASGGTASAGGSGQSASNSPDTFRNTSGTGSSSVTATAGSAFVAPGLAACGGAAGGGISTGNTAYNGGTQFLPSAQSAITGILLSNQSGGNASTTAAGGNGASGPNYGYGGCGGGASANGFNSGAGGNGGPGYVRITVWF